MVLRTKNLLLQLLLAICMCCLLAAPLGTNDRLTGIHLNLEDPTENASPSEPIKVLRSTDHDIIIQIRRPRLKQSEDQASRNDTDVSYHSEESTYNKHIKSKVKSVENHEEVRNDNNGTGKEIVKNRISRLSMHKLPHDLFHSYEAKEFKFQDKNNRRLLKDTVHETGNSHLNSFHFEEDNNKDKILDMVAKPEVNSFEFESLHGKNRPEDLGKIELSDEGNQKNKSASTEMNISDNQRKHNEFRSRPSLNDGKNKRELNVGSFNVLEQKSFQDGINQQLKQNLNFEGSEVKSTHQIRSETEASHSKKTPRSLSSHRTISFKRNDIAEIEKPKPTAKSVAIIQEKRNELTDDENKYLLDPKDVLRNKIIQIRSATLDSLQELKRKLQNQHEHLPLLPRTPILPPRPIAQPPPLQTYVGTPNQQPPPVYAPPPGPFYLPSRPIIVIPTEDPVLQAERAKNALQRMILFVNAMGKVDYYVSNAARNFVDMFTGHVQDYDRTVRSRHSRRNRCEDDKEEIYEEEGDDEGDDDSKGGYVRIRTSKSKRHSQENGGHKTARNRERPKSLEYGW